MKLAKIVDDAAKQNIFRTLVSEVRDYAIFLISLEGDILTWNKGASKIKGYSSDEIIGKNIRLFYTDKDDEAGIPMSNLCIAAERGSYECEGWRKRKDGSLFWADIVFTAMHDENGELIGFAKVTKELTSRKLEEDKFKELLDAAPDAMIISDAKGKIMLVNKQTENLFGFNRTELLGKKIEELIPKEKRKEHTAYRNNYFKAPATRPMGQHSKLSAAKKDGSYIPVEISLSPIHLTSETLYLAAVRDCTERNILTEALQKNNEELRLLAAHIESIREEERTSISREIHDQLGSQLSALKMDLSFIARKIPPDDEVLQNKLKSAKTLLDNIVRTVRKISSELRPGLLDDLGLPDAIRWYINDFLQHSEISFVLHVNVPDILIPSNISTTYFRVFQEALNNIVKHANATVVNISLTYKKSELSLKISDNGKGFDIAKLATKKTLGLLGIRERMSLVNGHSNIASKEGDGTIISISVFVSSSTYSQSLK